MLIDSNDPKYIEAYAYVKRSRNRQKVITILSTGRKTPTDIVEVMDSRFSLVSRILSELKDKEIVECINEHDKVGRLYILTELGSMIHEELESTN